MSGQNLKDQAHAWVRRLASGEATVADAQALKRWCDTSAAHAAAFADAQRLWRDFGTAGQQIMEREARPGAGRARAGAPRNRSRRVFLGGAIAASAAAVALVVYPPFAMWPSAQELDADFRTATGEQREVALADRITAQMNTQTSIARVSSTDMLETVKLIQGEVAFQSMRPAGDSFAVLTGNARTVATGEAGFEIRHIDDSVCVTCLTGEVYVEHGSYRRLLRDGQRAEYGPRGSERISAVDPARATAWRQGWVEFSHMPLRDAVAEINRYRPGRVILLEGALAKNEVSGRFHIHDMDQVIDQIRDAFGARITHLPGQIVLLG